jgi:hypothetical protein
VSVAAASKMTSPDYDPDTYRSEEYRSRIGAYYTTSGI